MLSSLLQNSTSANLDLTSLLICMVTSLFLGIIVARVHMIKNTYTKSFISTLVIMPILVQSVIMLVNGNLGTGMAVVGAFSLVRFRSVAGGAREITSIFWAMGIGLATGMGYVGYVLIFSAIVAILLTALYYSNFGTNQKVAERELKITISEDLDYPNLFDDLFTKYSHNYHLDTVKTTTMGSMYELRYHLTLKDQAYEKALIDDVRTRNGNLPVVLGKVATRTDQL
ncbi:DUF4956 domain-containing protein [Holzapfeliella sp. JNUCC 72]